MNPGLVDPGTWTSVLHTAHPGNSEHTLAKMAMWLTPGQGYPKPPCILVQMGHWPLLPWPGYPQPGHWVLPPELGQQRPDRKPPKGKRWAIRRISKLAPGALCLPVMKRGCHPTVLSGTRATRHRALLIFCHHQGRRIALGQVQLKIENQAIYLQ